MFVGCGFGVVGCGLLFVILGLWFVVCLILAAAVFECWHCFRDEWLPLFVVYGL